MTSVLLVLLFAPAPAPAPTGAAAGATPRPRVAALRKNGPDPLFHVLDHWSRSIPERLRITASAANLLDWLTADLDLLVVDGAAAADLSEAARNAVLAWVRAGGKLAVFGLEPTAAPWPSAAIAYQLGTAVGDVQFTSEDHPLTQRFAGTLVPARGSMCLPLLAAGWHVLARCEPGDAIALHGEGRGEIAVLQLPVEITSAHEMMLRFAAGLLHWAGAPRPPLGLPSALIEAEELSGNWLRAGQYHDLGAGGARLNDAATKGALSVRLPAATDERVLWVRAFEGHGVVRGVLAAIDGRPFPITHRGTRGERFNWWLSGVVPPTPAANHEDLLLSLEDNASLELVDALLIAPRGFDPTELGDALRALPTWNSEEDRALAEVRARLVGPATAADRSTWPARAGELRAALWRALGVTCAASRAAPRVEPLGEVDRGDHVLERIAIDTQPGVRVPANVYRPKTPAPWPAVLIAVGHWAKSKADPALQALAVDLARAGILALIPEPFGQGERDLPGSNHLFQGSLWMVGLTNRGLMLVDLVRALDYLEHRADVRADRLGCTGSSAGGMDSWLLGALDQRVVASAPVAFVTTYDEFFATRSRHCPCAYLPALAAEMDQGDVLALCAPRACLVVAGTRDPLFPISGTRTAVMAARAVYQSAGAAQRLSLFESDDVHALNQSMRERITGFFRAQLGEDASLTSVPERAPPVLEAKDPALRCFETAPQSGKALVDLANERAAELARALPAPASAAGDAELAAAWRERIRGTLRAPVDASGVLRWEREVSIGGDAVRVGVIDRGAGPALPLVAAGVDAGDGPLVVLVSGAGKDLLWMGPARAACRALKLGVVACDLRGAGELRVPDFLAARNAVLSGSTYLGERLLDLECVVRSVAPLARRGIVLCGLDLEGGVLAELCAALHPEVRGVTVAEELASFTSLIGRMNVPEPLFVPGVLDSFDLPQVRALIHAARLQQHGTWAEAARWIASTLR